MNQIPWMLSVYENLNSSINISSNNRENLEEEGVKSWSSTKLINNYPGGSLWKCLNEQFTFIDFHQVINYSTATLLSFNLLLTVIQLRSLLPSTCGGISISMICRPSTGVGATRSSWRTRFFLKINKDLKSFSLMILNNFNNYE